MIDMILEDIMSEFRISEEEAREILYNTYFNENLPVYVFTNEQSIHGTVAILDTENMDMIAEKIGSPFIVIPCSVHESIILPYQEKKNDYQDLETIISQINSTHLQKSEQLSEYMYMVDANTHTFFRYSCLVEKAYKF